jgi:hypothetical protein
MTAAEHEAWLKATGQYDAMAERHRSQEEARQSREAELRRAEAPLVRALAAVGLDVNSVWDLVNRTTRRYPEAVPVLLDHLKQPYPDEIRGGIARALTVSEARPHWDTLTRLYREEQGKHAKEGLAVAISGIVTDDLIADVIALVRDRRHGESRVLLLDALRRSKDPRAQQTLMELGADPDLQKQIQVIFKRKTRSVR